MDSEEEDTLSFSDKAFLDGSRANLTPAMGSAPRHRHHHYLRWRRTRGLDLLLPNRLVLCFTTSTRFSLRLRSRKFSGREFGWTTALVGVRRASLRASPHQRRSEQSQILFLASPKFFDMPCPGGRCCSGKVRHALTVPSLPTMLKYDQGTHFLPGICPVSPPLWRYHTTY